MKLQLNAQVKPYTATMLDDSVVIKNLKDGIDLLGNASYLGAGRIIIEGKHLSPDFYDLHSGFAGELLQKFSNNRMKLTIKGAWEDVNSSALRDFIVECNRGAAFAFESATAGMYIDH